MAFPPWENFDHVTASVSIDFHSNSKWMLLSMAQLIILMLIGKICDDLRDTPWKDTFKLSVSVATAAAEFCQSVQARTDVIFFIKNLWSTLVLLILP